ncbi:MAG: STAS domain-containing protein [Firmicutes bacterium]|nr:STAS domain-containing protein [Candidatus Fiminaster equi]
METTKQIEGKVLNLSISGHVDATTASELEKIVNEDVAKVEKIIFDFSNVEYISSAGLRVLLSVHKAMSSKGGELILENVSGDVKNVLEMTGFLSFLKVR